MLTDQMRAFGTTLRYAFAGAAVFALPNLIRNISQLNTQLSQVAAIGTTTGGIPIVGQRLNELRDDLLAVSTDTAQPVEQITEGVTRLYSTLENVPPNRAAEMMRTIAEVANTSQSDVTETTDAILGMINAFGAGPESIKRFGNAFRVVIAESAGMTGQMFSQSAGRVFQTGRLGNFSPATLFGASIAATRFGGSQPSNINNLSQMLLYLMQPPQNKSESALASIGLGKSARGRLGGDEVLRRFLAEVNRRGFASDPKFLRLGDEALGDLGDSSKMGTSGRGADLLQEILPRIQGRRIAAILATLSGPNPGKGNKSLQDYVRDSQRALDNANDLDKANKRAMDVNRYAQASNAMHNFGVEVAVALDPLLKLGSMGLTGLDRFAERHRKATRIGVLGALGVGAAAFVGRRTLGLGRLGRIGMGAVPAVAAGTDLVTGRAPTGAPDNPFFVVVMSSLGGGGGGPGVISRTARRGAPIIPGLAVGEVAAAAGSAAALTALTAGPIAGLALFAHHVGGGRTGFHTAARGHPLLSKYLRQGIGVAPGGGQDPSMAGITDIVMQYRRGGISAAIAEQLLKKPNTRIRTGHYSAIQESIGGALRLSGIAELELIYNQPDGTKARKKVHVRADNWGGGNHPQHRGRNNARRR